MPFDIPEMPSGAFLTKEEKAALAESGMAFEVTAVRDDDLNSFGARYVLELQVVDPASGEPEQKLLGFSKASPDGKAYSGRNSQLEAIKAEIARTGESGLAKLVKIGRMYGLAPAS